MFTRKGLLFLTGAIFLILIGIMIFEYQLIVIAIFFMVYIILSRPRIPENISVERETPNLKTFEGDNLDMGLIFHNESKKGKKKGNIDLNTNLVELLDTLPGYTPLANESNHKMFYLPSNYPKKVSYKLFCPIRGYYSIGPIYFRITDNSQFFYNDFSMVNYHVFPVHLGYKTIKRFEIRTKAFDWNLGQNLLNIQGKSSEFYSIRNYTKQDSYREINWKATAKRRELMVNTFERETLSDCCIFIDARDMTGLGRPHDNLLEYSIRLAYGLAKTIMKNNNRLSLVTYGNIINFAPPGLGNNHTEHINAMLLSTHAGGYLPFYAAMSHAWPYLKPKSTIVIFSPMDNDDTLFSSIISLQRMDMKIILVTSSILTFESRAIDKHTLRNEIDNVRRENQIRELERWGVNIVIWQPKDNFELILKKINTASGIKYGR
jgi:uncharacterized protein (DUF58 family)